MNISAVLIYYILYSGGHVTSGTQEFTEVATCQRAISELVRMEDETNKVKPDKIHIKASCLVK